jgi:arsenite-transporting ATPase
MKFLEAPPRFLFFTGKGGVGKTSVACAAALHLTGRAKRVLLVSTDPASNAGQVLGVTIGNTITSFDQVPGLSALEINPGQAAEAYRERIIAPVRGLLPDKELAMITEQLSGSCTTEIASFNEFTALLADESLTGRYDHVVFDTAPTGHTIRLLQLPGSWTDFLAAGKGDASCLGPLSGLAEIERTSGELGQIGITGQYVVINAVLPQTAGEDDLTRAVRAREASALAAMPPAIAGLPRDMLSLKAASMIGVETLSTLFSAASATAETCAPSLPDLPDAPLARLVGEILRADHGLVMCMGKGGVGKTTIAAAIAVALAQAGREVHLTTTDPAAHLTETLHGTVDGLQVSRIDPMAAVQAYRDHVMATKGKDLDEAGRAVLAEDLLSPCTEEIAVFQQFSRVLSESRRRFVVVDTAPTGHTLLLLDATGSYHREVARHLGDSMNFTTPLMRLQDPAQTKVILVTLAETTPVLEAQDLQEDLERAGIHPWAWVINNSIAAARPQAPFLRLRAASEAGQIERVSALAGRIALVPLRATEPTGEEHLAALANLTHQPA